MNWDKCVDNGIPTVRCIPIAIVNVVYGALALSGAAAVILLMISGVKFLLSSGDPIRVGQAKKTATWAIIGLVIVLLSFVMVNIVAKVTGAYCLIQILNCGGNP